MAVRYIQRQNLAILLCASTIGAANLARGESSVEDARALFREARQLATAGHYHAACAKFERSLQVESGIGTEYNLADCLEHVGRTATARQLFLKVAAAASQQNQVKREQAALERADQLLTRLTRLQIQCEGPCPTGLRVYRNDVELPIADWQEPTAVDPGTFRVEVGQTPQLWATQVSVPTDPVTIVVQIPMLTEARERSLPQERSRRLEREDAPARAAVAPRIERKRAVFVSLPTEDGRSRKVEESNALPKTLFWVGIGGLVLGGASTAILSYKNRQSSAICPTSQDCTDSEISEHDRLVSDAKLARIGVYSGFGLGILAIAGAATYYWTGTMRRERPPRPVAWRVTPTLAGDERSGWGAVAEGSW